MAIRKPFEMAMGEKKIRRLIAGYPGIGKTTLALSAPKPLLIDVDKGVLRVNARHRTDTADVQTYDELLKDLRPENLTEYETLVIDTGGQLLDLMKPWAIRQNAKNGQKNGRLTMQGYGVVGAEFARFVNDCFYKLNKNVVVIFHAKEEKDDDSTRLRILVEGSTKDNIWQPMDLGGFMEMEGQNRVIGFTNCERYFAKGTHGIHGKYTIPELGEDTPNDFLTRLFEKVQQNIQEDAQRYEAERRAYEAVMERLVPQIEAMTAQTILDVQAAIRDAEHCLTSGKEAKHRFKEKLKELRMHWDKEAGAYVSDDSEPAQ